MTLEEAIKLIQLDLDDEDIDWDSPLGRAYKLSFEALEYVKHTRGTSRGSFSTLLPGETKEDQSDRRASD